jgi:tetratricopeptide (TPR) repeat protein
VGHYATGDWGFEYRTFAELSFLAGARLGGGMGVGENGLEPRWVLLDGEDDVLKEIFLTDLPPKLRAHLAVYPRRDDDIRLPMPCHLGALANLVAADMKNVAHSLKAAKKGCAQIRIALTPTYRLRSAEIDDALEAVRRELPPKLRKKLSRQALVAEKQKSRRSEIPDTELLDQLSSALRADGATLLLFMTTWMLWHPDHASKSEPAMVVTDDSTLYEIGLDETIGLASPSPAGDPDECSKQVEAWASSLLRLPKGTPTAKVHAERLEALLWSTGLPLDHARVGHALHASAHAWGLLGLHDRAVSELDWAILLRPTPPLYNSRGYHKHLLRDFDGAIVDYTSAIEGKREAMYLANRAEAHLDLGRKRACITDARAALEIDPEHKAAKELLARAGRESR